MVAAIFCERQIMSSLCERRVNKQNNQCSGKKDELLETEFNTDTFLFESIQCNVESIMYSW